MTYGIPGLSCLGDESGCQGVTVAWKMSDYSDGTSDVADLVTGCWGFNESVDDLTCESNGPDADDGNGFTTLINDQVRVGEPEQKS